MDVIYAGSSHEAGDIIECVNTILSTHYGTMPYMRSMGIDSEVMNNAGTAREEFFNQAVEQIETWEDRADISEINFDSSGDGKLYAKVVIGNGE